MATSSNAPGSQVFSLGGLHAVLSLSGPYYFISDVEVYLWMGATSSCAQGLFLTVLRDHSGQGLGRGRGVALCVSGSVT